MNPRWILAATAAALLAASVAAQDVNLRTQKKGKQSITTITTVEPPKGPAPIRPRAYLPFGLNDPEVTPTVMHANKWVCGRQFTDDKGQVWTLVYGPRDPAKPEFETGWMIRSAAGNEYFMSELGGLYARPGTIAPSALPPPPARPAPPLPLGPGGALPQLLNSMSVNGLAITDMREVTLTAREWVAGKQFVDADGTTWRLVAGPAASGAPEKISGRAASHKDTKVYFISSAGGVFFPTPPKK